MKFIIFRNLLKNPLGSRDLLTVKETHTNFFKLWMVTLNTKNYFTVLNFFYKYIHFSFLAKFLMITFVEISHLQRRNYPLNLILVLPQQVHILTAKETLSADVETPIRCTRNNKLGFFYIFTLHILSMDGSWFNEKVLSWGTIHRLKTE